MVGWLHAYKVGFIAVSYCLPPVSNCERHVSNYKLGYFVNGSGKIAVLISTTTLAMFMVMFLPKRVNRIKVVVCSCIE